MALPVKITLKSKICFYTVANGGPRFTAKVDIRRQLDDLIKEVFCAAIHQLRQTCQLLGGADLEFTFVGIIPICLSGCTIPCNCGHRELRVLVTLLPLLAAFRQIVIQ